MKKLKLSDEQVNQIARQIADGICLDIETCNEYCEVEFFFEKDILIMVKMNILSNVEKIYDEYCIEGSYYNYEPYRVDILSIECVDDDDVDIDCDEYFSTIEEIVNDIYC